MLRAIICPARGWIGALPVGGRQRPYRFAASDQAACEKAGFRRVFDFELETGGPRHALCLFEVGRVLGAPPHRHSGPGGGYPTGMSGNRKRDTGGESARAGRHAGSGARGRQGATVEHSPRQRHERTATGAAGTERDLGRSKVDREGRREHREGTG